MNPKKGYVDTMDPWRELAAGVIRQAFHDYYVEQKKERQDEEKIQSIRDFILLVDSPFHQMLEISANLFPAFISRIDLAIERGEHYEHRLKPRSKSGNLAF